MCLRYRCDRQTGDTIRSAFAAGPMCPDNRPQQQQPMFLIYVHTMSVCAIVACFEWEQPDLLSYCPHSVILHMYIVYTLHAEI